MVATLRCSSQARVSCLGQLQIEYSDGTQEIIPETISQRSEFLKDIWASDGDFAESITLVPDQEQSLAVWIHFLQLHDDQKRVATNEYLANALQVR
jgi:hypothetical protein